MRSVHVFVAHSLSFVHISLVCYPSPYPSHLRSALALLATRSACSKRKKTAWPCCTPPYIADSF